MGEASGLLKVATADGAVLLEVSGLGDVDAVAVDDVALRVWALTGHTLHRFDFSGAEDLTTAVPPAPPAGAPQHPSGAAEPGTLVVDTADASIWVALNKNIYHLDAGGGLLLDLTLGRQIRGLALGHLQDGRAVLWAATNGEVTGLDPGTGATIASINPGPPASIKGVAVDAASGDVWMLRAGRLERYRSTGALIAAAGVNGLKLLASDAGGGCWSATTQNLYRIAADGAVLFSRRPFPTGGRIVAVIADPSDLSAWAASHSALVRYTDGGDEGLRVNLWNGLGIDSLGLYADVIAPTIHITSPADGAFLAEDRPSIELELADVGSGLDHGSLVLKANGTAFAATCTFDDTEGSAICTPDAALPETEIDLSAEIADLAGNLSDPAHAMFTVDMTPPEITVVTPADGLLTNQPQQTATGSVSEPSELHLNGTPVPLDEQNAFSYGPVTLVEGGNLLAFVATDRAGNQAETDVAVTLDTIPPAAVPAESVTTGGGSGGQVQVTVAAGAAEAGTTCTITNPANGAQAGGTVGPDGGFTASIAAAEGDTSKSSSPTAPATPVRPPACPWVSRCPPIRSTWRRPWTIPW